MHTERTEEVELDLVVVARRQLTADIIEVEFAASNGTPLPEWSPGAHADFVLTDDLVRQYSLLTGRVDENNWRIAVLVERDGRGGSRHMARSLHEGSRLHARGPRNHFPLVVDESSHYIFVAGGIGISAVLPMAERIARTSANWSLLYLGKSRTNMAYVDEVVERFPANVSLHVAADGTRLDVESVVSRVAHPTHVYVCGPERLNLAFEAIGDEAPVTVHIERFVPREVSHDDDVEFTVFLERSQVELTIPVDESISLVADAAGIEIPGDCFEGTCGSCETRIVRGSVIHKDSILTAAEQAANETMMICVSRSRGADLVIDL